MSSNDTPFGALDKMLFSSPPVPKKKGRKKAKGAKSNQTKQRAKKKASRRVNQTGRPNQSTRPVNQSGQSIDPARRLDQAGRPTQSTQPVDPATGQLMGEVVTRPLAFYIPVSINEKLEEAVRYYQKKYHRKIDRSAVVSALLGDPAIWDRTALDQIADSILAQLKNRLKERLMNRLK